MMLNSISPIKKYLGRARNLVRNSGQKTIGQNLTAFSKRNRKIAEYTSRPTSFEDKIELIIPCYNHAKYLPMAFESICKQTAAQPITVTFVDDSSTDNTKEVIKKLTRTNHPGWISVKTIYNKQNLRQWASLNNAIKQSENELVIILNDDDMLRPDAINKIVRTYQNQPKIFLLGAGSIWLEANCKPKLAKVIPYEQLELTIHSPDETRRYKNLNDLNMTQSSCSFFKVAWSAVGGVPAKGRSD